MDVLKHSPNSSSNSSSSSTLNLNRGGGLAAHNLIKRQHNSTIEISKFNDPNYNYPRLCFEKPSLHLNIYICMLCAYALLSNKGL